MPGLSQACKHIPLKLLQPNTEVHCVCMYNVLKSRICFCSFFIYTVSFICFIFYVVHVFTVLFATASYIHSQPHFHSLSTGACTLLRSSLKLGPSSVTSAISSAWLWRNLFKSTGPCTEWFPLIYICLTLWLTEPISLSWPWRRTDTHSQVRWGGVSLTDWQTVTEPLGHFQTISAQQDGSISSVYRCVRIHGFAWVFTYIAGFTSVGGHTLSVVTNNQAGQIGQAPYLQRLAGLNNPTGRDCTRRLPGQNDVHTTHKHEPLFLCYAYVVI